MAAKDTPDENMADVKMKVLQVVPDMITNKKAARDYPGRLLNVGANAATFFLSSRPWFCGCYRTECRLERG